MRFAAALRFDDDDVSRSDCVTAADDVAAFERADGRRWRSERCRRDDDDDDDDSASSSAGRESCSSLSTTKLDADGAGAGASRVRLDASRGVEGADALAATPIDRSSARDADAASEARALSSAGMVSSASDGRLFACRLMQS